MLELTRERLIELRELDSMPKREEIPVICSMALRAIPLSDLSRIAAVLERAKELASLGNRSACAWEHGNTAECRRADKEIEAIEAELTAVLSLLPTVCVETKGGA